MNIVKTRLYNRMENQWMNDYLLAYIEKDLLDKLDNNLIHRSISKHENS